MKNLLFCFFVFLFISSCKKEDIIKDRRIEIAELSFNSSPYHYQNDDSVVTVFFDSIVVGAYPISLIRKIEQSPEFNFVSLKKYDDTRILIFKEKKEDKFKMIDTKPFVEFHFRSPNTILFSRRSGCVVGCLSIEPLEFH